MLSRVGVSPLNAANIQAAKKYYFKDKEVTCIRVYPVLQRAAIELKTGKVISVKCSQLTNKPTN